MEALVDAWSSWPPEVREKVLRVQDPEIVSYIGMNMRLLWTAELQAQMLGVQGPVHPYDHEKLPFLSTMQFDEPESGVQSVKWPAGFYEDPVIVPSAIRGSLQRKGAKRSPQKVLKPGQWQQLLQPPAKSWIDFEKQLALLAEQMVLNARMGRRELQDNADRGGQTVEAPSPAPAHAPKPSAVSSTSPAEGGDLATTEQQAPENNSGGEEADAAAAFPTSRAAKRARQRERRRHGKALALQVKALEASVGSSGMANCDGIAAWPAPVEVPAPASVECSAALDCSATVDLPPMSEPAVVDISSLNADANGKAADSDGARAGDHATKDSLSLDDVEKARLEVQTSVLSVLKVQADSLSRQLSQDKSSSLLSAKKEEPAVVVPLTASSSDAAASKKSSTGSRGKKEAATVPQLAGFAGAAKGIGRGRPMASLDRVQDQSNLIPHGRGRMLEPPPGLQAVRSTAPSLGMPGGLSQPWIPGPAIPEDEDVDFQEMCGWQMTEMELDPYSSDHNPSSYWPTPSMHWAKTPSPPVTPGLSLPSTNFTADMMASALDAAACSSPVGHPIESGVVPMYVTVPLALAHSCPHCGCQFATLPGAADDQDDDAKTSPAGSSVGGA